MKPNIIAGIAGILALGLAVGLMVQQQKINALTLEAAAAGDLEAKLAASSARIAALEQQIAASKTEKAADPVKSGVEPAALLKGLLGGVTDAMQKDGAPAKSQSEPSKNPFATMFEGEQGERMMEAGMEMTVNMQYGGLFADMELTPEKEAALKEALLIHQRAMAEGGMAAMRGEKQPENWTPPTNDDLLASVKEILTPEEYDAFATYQEELPERMMRQQVESQLGVFAAGLSDDAYALTVDVLVDKLTGATHAQAEAFSSENAKPEEAMGTMGNAMQDAYDEAMVELEGSLSPEDAARVRRYIDQQRSMFQMFSTMSSDGANVGVVFQAETPAAE